jgi:2'-5' RNA ligase
MSAPSKASERWFFAALPGASTRAQIAAAAAALTLGAAAQRVPPANHHTTLAFIGMIPPASVSVLREIGAAQRCDAFALRFDGYEYWPKPEVLVTAAPVIPPALEQLWHRLHGALAVHQWALAPKRLRPHITLARNIVQAPVLPAMSPFDWAVSEFSLMRSEPGVEHSAYTVVDTWSLLDDRSKTWKNSEI